MKNGRFYFKLTTNGNLLGEYSNDDCRCSYTEAANRILPSDEALPLLSGSNFPGHFVSTWYEVRDKGSVTADLVIKPKQSCLGIFTLVWKEIKNGATPNGKLFEGEAMLCDETLIGNYWAAS